MKPCYFTKVSHIYTNDYHTKKQGTHIPHTVGGGGGRKGGGESQLKLYMPTSVEHLDTAFCIPKT